MKWNTDSGMGLGMNSSQLISFGRHGSDVCRILIPFQLSATSEGFMTITPSPTTNLDTSNKFLSSALFSYITPNTCPVLPASLYYKNKNFYGFNNHYISQQVDHVSTLLKSCWQSISMPNKWGQVIFTLPSHNLGKGRKNKYYRKFTLFFY